MARSSLDVLNTWQYVHQEGVTPPAGIRAARFFIGVPGNNAGNAQAYFDSLYLTPAPGRF